MPADVLYGTYTQDAEGRQAVSSVDIRVSAVDMVVHWRRCSLTADFLAGFLAPNFREEEAARSQLSMIIDELIENAVKFCADVSEPVSVTVHNFGDAIQVEATNLCDEERARDLGQAIRRALESDAETLFLEQIEESAAQDRDASRLGFITLRLNRGARLGARIVEADQGGLYNVTVQVLLAKDEEASLS